MPFTLPKAGFFLLLICACCLAACSQAKKPKKNSLAIPADEATQEERAQLDATISEIERIAADLGRPQQFRSLPVLVTSESMQASKRAGACYSEDGNGKFILVNRRVLEVETSMASAGIETTLFRVLLHEIGHCYFAREHHDARIEQDGLKIEWKRSLKQSENMYFASLNVSSMETNTLTLPLVLKNYYVAEILGLARAATLADLEQYAPLVFVNSRQ